MQNIPGILGCLFGACALIIVLLQSPDETNPSDNPRKISENSGDQFSKGWERSKSEPTVEEELMSEAVLQAAIDEALEAKFADTEWFSTKLAGLAEDPKGSDKIREVMGRRNQYHRIDLSDYPTTEGKIDAILRRFLGQNHYSSNNDLVKQMREMGPDSIDLLMERLNLVGSQDWAQRMALVDALKGRIPEDHREEVIRQFRKSGAFVDFIKDYQVTEVEDQLMGVIAGTQQFENNQHTGNYRDLMEAAIRLNPDRAEDALFEHARYGDRPGEAAQMLASLPDVDPRPAIETALPRLSNRYQRANMVPIALEHGASGSLELAERALRENAKDGYRTDQVLKAVRLHTGAIGDPIDVADWIAANRDQFIWNPEARAYVLP
ncbi:hypothetical protein [Puniceicoccus vermicola]|uniref:Uncharacterized protein n=1 Tax=Puniceicoccus vermicola TaxID=388746 RepID=A0A7X1AU93_9BACT|nr:hypothetical protein [Puniceicoccus vermicola]MBC2600160.1 hypothetical protein [Puniceicoccus vermicola]